MTLLRGQNLTFVGLDYLPLLTSRQCLAGGGDVLGWRGELWGHAEEPLKSQLECAIDPGGLGSLVGAGHLPQLTDYYRLCPDLDLERLPSQ